jgi:hypothetical protein
MPIHTYNVQEGSFAAKDIIIQKQRNRQSFSIEIILAID